MIIDHIKTCTDKIRLVLLSRVVALALSTAQSQEMKEGVLRVL